MSELLETTKKLNESNAFANHNHVELIDVSPDYAECCLVLTPESLNPLGSAHGGALFTLADVCAGVTARTDGRRYVTQEASVSFLRGCREGRMTARSRVVNRSRSFCMVEINITDEQEKLLFSGTFHFYCIDH